MWPLTLAVTISWTNPGLSAARVPIDSAVTVVQCYGDAPLRDLAAIEVHGAQRWRGGDSLLTRVEARGMEGLAQSWTSGLAGVWSLWLVAVDLAGNRSCISNIVGVNLMLDVPPPPDPETRYYDIAGRHIERPEAPGVYFTREAGRSRRIVILR